MATVVRESVDSRNVQTQAGRLNGRRSFFVYDDGTGTAITDPEQVTALFGTATTPDLLPNQGQPFPGIEIMAASDYTLELLPDMVNVWKVEWAYEDAVSPGPGPNDPSYVEINFTTRRIFDNLWRTGAATPTNGTVQGAALFADIGGTAIDIAGQPTSVQRLQLTLRISEVVTVATGSFPPLTNTYLSMTGRRNNTVFYTAPVGKFVYEGATSTRVARNKFRVEHAFTYDEAYHLVQIPKRNVDGIIPTTASSGNNYVASDVYWRQPFPLFGDFNALSNNF